MRIYFLHIPKTAGQSLSATLDDLFDHDQICPHQNPSDFLRSGLDSFDKYNLIRGHTPFNWVINSSKVNIDTYFSLTFLRDPLERVLSAQRHWKIDPTVSIDPPLWIENAMTKMLSGLTTDQSHTLADHVASAKDTIDRLNFIGITEMYDQSLSLLASRLSFPVEYLQPRVINKGNNKLSKLSSNAIDLLKENNAADFEVYEYGIQRFLRDINKFEGVELHEKRGLSQESWRASSPLYGSGFWQREMGIGLPQPWRWTGPDLDSVIYFSHGEGEWLVDIRVVNSMTPDILLNLAFFIDGMELCCEQIRDDIWGIIFRAKFFRQSIKQPLELRINVPRTIKFSEVDASVADDRSCGVAISEINFYKLLGV